MAAPILTAEQRTTLYDELTDTLGDKGYDPDDQTLERVMGAVAAFRIIGWKRIDEPLDELPAGLNVEDYEEAMPALRYWLDGAKETRETARPDFEWADSRVRGIESLIGAMSA